MPTYSQIEYAVQKVQPRTVQFLTEAWNTLNTFRMSIRRDLYKTLPGNMKKLIKKFGRMEALLHKKLVCLEPRLKRKYGILVFPEG